MTVVVNEFTLLQLHLLSALHDQLQKAGGTMVVSMLTQKGLQAVWDRAASSSSAAAARPRIAEPLQFVADKDSPISLRWCDSWQDASDRGVDSIYMASLTWLSSDGCHYDHVRAQHFRGMLQRLNATLCPPESWDQLLERKDCVYSKFNKWMLPALWVALDNVGGDMARCAASLLTFCRRGDGDYMLKGSFSACASCAKRITIRAGKCSELAGVLEEFVQTKHQQSVGIQPFIAGFSDFELRTWIVVDPVTKRWRPTLTMKTSVTDGSVITAELFQPMHGVGLRVAELVDELLRERADFFTKVHELGIPALRIDCGYDLAIHGAFFSEFSPAGDAAMWSGVHEQDLAYVIGRAMGDLLWSSEQK